MLCPALAARGRALPTQHSLLGWAVVLSIASVADTATYLVLFLAVLWLWPDFIATHYPLLATALGLYAVNHLWALARFHMLPAYHTWAGKTAAVLMAAGMILWFVCASGALFTTAVIVSIFSALEQLAITASLPHWQADVPTLVHALRLRRPAQPRQP